MWSDLFRAIALVFIIEGLMPFLAPDRWREMVTRLSHTDSRSLRVFGGVMIGVGAVLLQFIH